MGFFFALDKIRHVTRFKIFVEIWLTTKIHCDRKKSLNPVGMGELEQTKRNLVTAHI